MWSHYRHRRPLEYGISWLSCSPTRYNTTPVNSAIRWHSAIEIVIWKLANPHWDAWFTSTAKRLYHTQIRLCNQVTGVNDVWWVNTIKILIYRSIKYGSLGTTFFIIVKNIYCILGVMLMDQQPYLELLIICTINS